jgi:CheY-like chemotaxis protein
LVITDLEMPGRSGYEVAKFIKGKNRHNKFLPVVMLTGKEISKDEARRNGCATYIPKSNLQKVVSMAKILFNAKPSPSVS